MSHKVAESGEESREAVSADGTRITLRRVTSGDRPLVLLSGAVNRSRAWANVAGCLAGRFSCWLMDRRGKGDSGDREPYSFEREYEDVAAAADLFHQPVSFAGHSSGAICVLGAAALGAGIANQFLYEPPWPTEGTPASGERVRAMEDLIAEGDREAALLLGLRELVGLPEGAIEGMKATPAWADRLALVHTWPREMREVDRLPRDLHALRSVDSPALLLVGTVTSAEVKRSTAALAEALPRATVAELPGQGHGALAFAPELVATTILSFN